MVLGTTQSLTEMSTKITYWGVKTAGALGRQRLLIVVLFLWARVTDNIGERICELWVTWDKRGAERADEYIFFCTEKEIENHAPIVLKFGILFFLEPPGATQARTGFALPFITCIM